MTTDKRFSPRPVLVVTLSVLFGLVGCSEQIIETQKPIGGTCLACHDGITDIHPKFALACVDCHGGNDRYRQNYRQTYGPNRHYPGAKYAK
jgi:hypothetical protein